MYFLFLETFSPGNRSDGSVSRGILSVRQLFPELFWVYFCFIERTFLFFFLFLSSFHHSHHFPLPPCVNSVSVTPGESEHVFLLYCGSCDFFFCWSSPFDQFSWSTEFLLQLGEREKYRKPIAMRVVVLVLSHFSAC